MKPTEVTILGKRYSITYFDKPSEVDRNGRDSLWGQIDFWTNSIRIYDNKTTEEQLWETIFHEILHGIITELNIKGKIDRTEKEGHEDIVSLLALALVDILFRNGWLVR